MKIACKNFVGAAVMVGLLGAGHTASALAAEMSHHGAMSSDLRTGLNSLFREHVFLAAGLRAPRWPAATANSKPPPVPSTPTPSILPKLSARFMALAPSRPFFPYGASISASLSIIPSASQPRTTPRKIKPSPISSNIHKTSAPSSPRQILICPRTWSPIW